jgi:hypothetical protein
MRKIVFLFSLILCVVFVSNFGEGAVFQFQRALQALYVSFDNATNGFTATEVQSAIEEARATALGKPRFLASAGFDGNASVGRYLEFNSNVDSYQTGYVNANPSWLKEISCGCNTTATITFTVAKVGGADIGTCTITGARKGVTTGLTQSISSLDEISVRVTSGSCSRPITWLFFQIQ